MKKEILFVINSLGLGGAEKSLISLLTSFDYNKYNVDLLMFRSEGMFLKLLPVEVNILPELDFLTSNRSLKRQIENPKYLIARLRASIELRKNSKTKTLHPAQCYWKYSGNCFNSIDKKYDVAFAWGQGNPTHYVAKKVHADKKIAFINADYENVGHNKEFDFKFYQNYDFIVAVSDELFEKIKLVFPDFSDKMRTIYDINNAELIKKMADESNPYVNIRDRVIIVTVGRIVEQKGYDIAVEAARILRDSNIDFQWFFVGDGVSRNEIEKLISEYHLVDKIILTGAKDNPYVYMKNADIYVQTSRFEGYCLTLGEARILNKPIVSTNFDVVYNQLKNGENGLIVEMSGNAVAEGIQLLINNPSLCNSLVNSLTNEKKGNVEEIKKIFQLIEAG